MSGKILGVGYRVCEKCGEAVFGSTIHYCKKDVMSDIQITEEKARKMYQDGHSIVDYKKRYEDIFIDNIRKAGYIIKSELQQKVEEAEEMYKKWKKIFLSNNSEANYKDQTIEYMYDLIQLLIKNTRRNLNE